MVFTSLEFNGSADDGDDDGSDVPDVAFDGCLMEKFICRNLTWVQRPG